MQFMLLLVHFVRVVVFPGIGKENLSTQLKIMKNNRKKEDQSASLFFLLFSETVI